MSISPVSPDAARQTAQRWIHISEGDVSQAMRQTARVTPDQDFSHSLTELYN